jgi:hypothetical protein
MWGKLLFARNANCDSRPRFAPSSYLEFSASKYGSGFLICAQAVHFTPSEKC